MIRTGVLGGVALCLSPAWAARQKTAVEGQSAQSVVAAVGSLLQANGAAGLALELMQRASSEVTPGLDSDFSTAFGKALGKIEDVEGAIKKGQKATQAQLDKQFEAFGVEAANALKSKRAADKADNDWFQCVDAQRLSQRNIETTQDQLKAATKSKAEACKLLQDSDDFKYESPIRDSDLKFQCSHADKGDCQTELQEFEGMLDKEMKEADAKMAAKQKNYADLKSDCEAKKRAEVVAKGAVGKAQRAFKLQEMQCKKDSEVRVPHICAFGKKMQSKCAAEESYRALAAATKKVKGGAHSEADRKKEWTSTAVTRCAFEKYLQQGNVELARADIDECSRGVKFEDFGRALDVKMAAFEALAGRESCVEGPISFNGETWNVPANGTSSSYKRSEFRPKLSLNIQRDAFDFCAGVKLPAEPPSVAEEMPNPVLQVKDAYCSDRGGTGGNNEFSKRIPSLGACAAYVKSVADCGPRFSYGFVQKWCDCVPAGKGECRPSNYEGYNTYKLEEPMQCNWQCYSKRYSDLQKAFGGNVGALKDHYLISGMREGRDCTCQEATRAGARRAGAKGAGVSGAASMPMDAEFDTGSTLHKIQLPGQCGITWSEVRTEVVETIDSAKFHVGATLSSWGCDRLASEDYGRLKVGSVEYAVVSCGSS